jgi:spermidine synthase
MESIGRALIAELSGCPPLLLNDVALIEHRLVAAARASRATVINVSFHHFAPFGVSGVVVIQESHIAIHSWPEYGYAALDIFTCGQTIDPWVIYREVAAALEAQQASATEVVRGPRSLLTPQQLPGHGALGPLGPAGALPAPATRRAVWFTELQSAIAVSLRHSGQPLCKRRSPHQLIEIYDTAAYGRMLVLDGLVASTEYDEFIYHEMMVHPAALVHPCPRRALILGGGDGGIARELARYPELDEIVVVEQDEQVLAVAREFLPALSRGLLDPRVRVEIGDSLRYLHEAEAESFDLVLCDIQPGGPPVSALASAALRVLRPDGALVAQGGSPHIEGHTLPAVYAEHGQVFGPARIFPYLLAVPTYPSGLWCLLFCARGEVDPVAGLDSNRARALSLCAQHRLRYFSPAVHAAAFALPGYIRAQLDGASSARSQPRHVDP